MVQDKKPDPKEELDAIEALLGSYFNELSLVHLAPRPDYTRHGVEVVFNALVQARAAGDRASHLHAAATRQRGFAESLYKAAEDAVNARRDPVVRRLSVALGGLSWSERDSHYRVELVGEMMFLRRCEKILTRILALVEAIAIQAKSIERARYDLNAVAEAMKFAHALGEITSA